MEVAVKVVMECDAVDGGRVQWVQFGAALYCTVLYNNTHYYYHYCIGRVVSLLYPTTLPDRTAP